MKRISIRLLEVTMFAALVAASVISFGQIRAGAQSTPACAGLSCSEQQDCGSKCFCNRPSTTCYQDALDVE